MILLLIFLICSSFFVQIQEQIKLLPYQENTMQEQLKTIACTLRTMEKIEPMNSEETLGISKTFFKTEVDIKNGSSQEIEPFDSLLLNTTQKFEVAPTIFETNAEIFFNHQKLNCNAILYYSKFLITNLIKISPHFITNPTSSMQNAPI